MRERARYAQFLREELEDEAVVVVVDFTSYKVRL